ncbi:MAG: glutamyl-tRNA reductase [Blautia sp.]|nr:glutamyl-tRNA reductase [Blautia sp.]
MHISMIGIDHNRAPVDVRALFAFTRKLSGEAMERLKGCPGIDGCVILSTCNRLEIWASSKDGAPDLLGWLCADKEVEIEKYRDLFVSREDKDAVEHLFYLTSGLRSQIIGEDQIITQVKDALTVAREHFATDSVMEVLFRMAVTAGKRIKTEVTFSHGSRSVIHDAIEKLDRQGFSVRGKTCMVIGNGEMGKVASSALLDEGADVSVTIRQYRSGIVDIPWGCKRINYTDRMELFPRCDLVVSATASPNFTLRTEQVADATLFKPVILIDLAVPRDIEPEVGNLPGITLYDMDSFGSDRVLEEQQGSLEQADAIVREQMDEFYGWLDGRDVIPRLQKLQQDAVEDLYVRIEKTFRKAEIPDEEREKLEKTVRTAAGKVMNKMMFGLRDNLSPDGFMNCVKGLEMLYEE